MSNQATIRPADAGDREAFLAMWEDFVSLDPDEPGDRGMGARNWARVVDEANPLQGMIAVDEHGDQRGFVLFLTFPFTWSRGDICYLQDIYVHPASRGKGLARAMITTLAEIGRREDWFKIFWMTQSHNVVAQGLYDKIAERKDYIRYDLPIETP
jgi:ribosomal protein S18 acetylase RimI-like enzyme